MADRGDTHYSMRAMNLWFLVTSVLLLLTTVWMVLDDYNRSWKRYQREFRKLEVAKTEQEIQALESEGALEREAELKAAVEAAERDLKERRSELVVAEEELRQAKGEYWRLNETAKKTKAGYNWERFLVEEERDNAGDPTLGEDRLAHAEADMLATAFAAETALNAQEAAQQRLDAMRLATTEPEAVLFVQVAQVAHAVPEPFTVGDLGQVVGFDPRDVGPGHGRTLHN